MRQHSDAARHQAPCLPLTRHARQRMAQRAISCTAIEAALAWGTEYHQRGCRTAYFLGKRAVARARQAGIQLRGFMNTAVVVAADGAVITTIRTTNARRLRTGGA